MYYGNTWETSKRSNKDKLLVIGTRYRLIKMFLIKFFYSLLKNLHNCFNKTSSVPPLISDLSFKSNNS